MALVFSSSFSFLASSIKLSTFDRHNFFLRPHSLRACHSLVDFTYVYTYLFYTQSIRAQHGMKLKKTCQTPLVLELGERVVKCAMMKDSVKSVIGSA